VILAALFFMRRMSDSVQVELQPAQGRPGDGILVYSIEGPLFFGVAEKLERALEHLRRPATTLILRMGNMPFLDATGIFAIEEIITDFKRHGGTLMLTELRPNVRYKLERGGVLAQIGPDRVTDTLEQALQRARELTPDNARGAS
jgi:SulP family sulfate permease